MTTRQLERQNAELINLLRAYLNTAGDTHGFSKLADIDDKARKLFLKYGIPQRIQSTKEAM